MQDVSHRIVEEANACLLAAGARCLNLDKLAATLRISKKTIYQHFPTKAALLEGVFQRHQQQAWAQHEQFRQVPTAPEELQLLLRWFEEQHLALAPGYMAELARAAPSCTSCGSSIRPPTWYCYLSATYSAGRPRVPTAPSTRRCSAGGAWPS